MNIANVLAHWRHLLWIIPALLLLRWCWSGSDAPSSVPVNSSNQAQTNSNGYYTQQPTWQQAPVGYPQNGQTNGYGYQPYSPQPATQTYYPNQANTYSQQPATQTYYPNQGNAPTPYSNQQYHNPQNYPQVPYNGSSYPQQSYYPNQGNRYSQQPSTQTYYSNQGNGSASYSNQQYNTPQTIYNPTPYGNYNEPSTQPQYYNNAQQWQQQPNYNWQQPMQPQYRPLDVDKNPQSTQQPYNPYRR